MSLNVNSSEINNSIFGRNLKCWQKKTTTQVYVHVTWLRFRHFICKWYKTVYHNTIATNAPAPASEQRTKKKIIETHFLHRKSNNFIILFIGIDCTLRPVAPHARHDCDLFATYVAFWWLNECIRSNTACHFLRTIVHCLMAQPPALATLFIKCKCIYVKFNSLCGLELLLMIWFTFEYMHKTLFV